jgi:hypothetical protein
MLLEIPAYEGMAARAVSYIMLFFSGFVSLLGGLDGSHTGFEIAKRSEVDAVEFATQDLPVESTFAGTPTYNHPLLLSGCKMTEGYTGHLFSHGIDYEARDAELKEMMKGGAQWEAIAEKLNVRYLYWGRLEQETYPESTEPWTNFPVAAAGSWGTIYDLEGPAPIR